MTRFILSHRHDPEQCAVAFASWRGFSSPLRHQAAVGTCEGTNGSAQHEIWWFVDAGDPEAALAQLPPFVAERAEAKQVGEVSIP